MGWYLGLAMTVSELEITVHARIMAVFQIALNPIT